MVKDAHERCEQKPTTSAFQNERPCERLPKGFRVEKLANPLGCPSKVNVVDDILGLIGQFLKIFYRLAQRIIWEKLCACEKRCVWAQIVGDDVAASHPSLERYSARSRKRIV